MCTCRYACDGRQPIRVQQGVSEVSPLLVIIIFPITDVDVQITSITASLLAFAILTFITGFFLGALLVRCIMKSPKKDEVVPVPGSVTLYEEITQPPSSSALTGQEFEVMKIEANEAYGCI